MKTTLSPMLSVRNGIQAIEFYKTAFGAVELFRVGDGVPVVAQLAIDGCNFWLADESPEHCNFSPESLGGGTDRAVAVGASVVWPVADQPYGWRVGRIADPFGHHWEIGRPLA